MASVNLAAAALAAVVLLCAVATTATAKRPYQPEPLPQPPEHEDCKTQAEYFKNCLRHGLHEACCDDKHHIPVAEQKCYCQVEREAEIECAPGRHCSAFAGKVKVAEMHLSCLKNLKCKKQA
ncbi:unnamed protein product [Alopecurus aequalis]